MDLLREAVNSHVCITALREHDWPKRLSHLFEQALMETCTLNELENATVSKL